IRLADKAKILGAGISVGGKVSEDGRTIISCPYLPWDNIPIAEAFEQVLKMQAVARNSTYALVDAERYASYGTDLLVSDDPIIYIEWGKLGQHGPGLRRPCLRCRKRLCPP
ncbi:MAG: hypothetical protein IJM52_10665, partial [Spirochaetales bacterium]|nr:hypothetical protein [Spirochaetales bacterium]